MLIPVELLEAVLEFLPVEQGILFRQVCAATRAIRVRPNALMIGWHQSCWLHAVQ